jgi:hypothetical protein
MAGATNTGPTSAATSRSPERSLRSPATASLEPGAKSAHRSSAQSRDWRRASPSRFRPRDLSQWESGATRPSGHGRLRVHAVKRKQGARLDGHAVGRVDDARSCEFGELRVGRQTSGSDLLSLPRGTSATRQRSSPATNVTDACVSSKALWRASRNRVRTCPCRPLLAWERGTSRRRRRASSHACNFVKGELWLARGRNAWVSRPTPRTRESSYQDPLLLVLTPSRCQCGDAHSTFGSPIGRDRRVMTIPAARSAAAEALAS